MESKLRKIRKERGLSQKRLAIMADLTPAQVSLCESGYVPGPTLRKRIAEALGVSETALWPELLEKEAAK